MKGERHAWINRPDGQRGAGAAASVSEGAGLHGRVVPAERQLSAVLQGLHQRLDCLHELGVRLLRQQGVLLTAYFRRLRYGGTAYYSAWTYGACGSTAALAGG